MNLTNALVVASCVSFVGCTIAFSIIHFSLRGCTCGEREGEDFEDRWKHLRQLEQQKKDLEETFEVMKTNNNVVWLKSSKIRVKD